MTSPERDTQLLAVGTQCGHVSCNLVDFLPFKCQHCRESFCQDHFLWNAHSCPKYDESKHNRVAPDCEGSYSKPGSDQANNSRATGPLCNTPVAIPVGQDPNVRMEQHFERECSVMTGRRAKGTVPICARGRCGKALYAPIACTVRIHYSLHGNGAHTTL